MAATKHRERKCSTCKHYQPSPLWRKGWCRNPLLYDRNTNHLVEADSLSCNRTFIDYWEPIEGPAPEVGPHPKSPKPRIAPSIPIGTVDAKGRRKMVTGNTPSAVWCWRARRTSTPPSRRAAEAALSVVTPDYDTEETLEDQSKRPPDDQIEGPMSPQRGGSPLTTAQRIRQARASEHRFISIQPPSALPCYCSRGHTRLVGRSCTLPEPHSPGRPRSGRPDPYRTTCDAHRLRRPYAYHYSLPDACVTPSGCNRHQWLGRSSKHADRPRCSGRAEYICT